MARRQRLRSNVAVAHGARVDGVRKVRARCAQLGSRPRCFGRRRECVVNALACWWPECGAGRPPLCGADVLGCRDTGVQHTHVHHCDVRDEEAPGPSRESEDLLEIDVHRILSARVVDPNSTHHDGGLDRQANE